MRSKMDRKRRRRTARNKKRLDELQKKMHSMNALVGKLQSNYVRPVTVPVVWFDQLNKLQFSLARAEHEQCTHAVVDYTNEGYTMMTAARDIVSVPQFRLGCRQVIDHYQLRRQHHPEQFLRRIATDLARNIADAVLDQLLQNVPSIPTFPTTYPIT